MFSFSSFSYAENSEGQGCGCEAIEMRLRAAMGQIVLGVKGVAEFSSKTVPDGKSLNPRSRSGVLVPWDMPKPQGGDQIGQ